MPERILVVDDDPHVRDVLVYTLRRHEFDVTECGDPETALAACHQTEFDVLFTDLKMPGMDGVTLFHHAKAVLPALMGIVVTAHGTIDSAVRAMKEGIFDYITKPFLVDEIVASLQRALEFRRLVAENKALKRQLKTKYHYERFLGQSAAIQRVFSLIDRVAETDSTVLILGDSGTGKELVARTIHFNGPRAEKPLVSVNCGALPETLLESELFGHERGAFTGANSTRIGRFELAHGGTIFLDEIGEMSPSLQVKLLRVLQQRSFERVGGMKTIHVDVRVIAATNRDLEEAIRDGRFREDLYYRLNVIPIVVPALRERPDDIPLLVNHFLAVFNEEKRKDVQGVSEEAMRVLCAYSWPGNVRELENLIERVVILKGEGTITPDDLPEKMLRRDPDATLPSVVFPSEGVDFNRLVEAFEDDLIQRALKAAGGVKNRAAQLLRLNRTTLVEKMKKSARVLPHH
ncbi:MAG: sigma-54 dependent transcriptional regulator [Nitrospirota bacterium]